MTETEKTSSAPLNRKIQVQNTEMQNHFRMLQHMSFLLMIFKAAIPEVLSKKVLLKKTVPVLPTPHAFLKKLNSLNLRWTFLWKLLMAVRNRS